MKFLRKCNDSIRTLFELGNSKDEVRYVYIYMVLMLICFILGLTLGYYKHHHPTATKTDVDDSMIYVETIYVETTEYTDPAKE